MVIFWFIWSPCLLDYNINIISFKASPKILFNRSVGPNFVILSIFIFNSQFHVLLTCIQCFMIFIWTSCLLIFGFMSHKWCYMQIHSTIKKNLYFFKPTPHTETLFHLFHISSIGLAISRIACYWRHTPCSSVFGPNRHNCWDIKLIIHL